MQTVESGLVFIRGSVRAYGDNEFGGVSFKASWPFGGIRIGRDRIELIVLGRSFVVEKTELGRIDSYILPRPYIRLFHYNSVIPSVLIFGTIRGYYLKKVLINNGYSIASSFWIEPRKNLNYYTPGR